MKKSVVLVMVPILVIAQAGILVQFAAAGYHLPFIKDPTVVIYAMKNYQKKPIISYIASMFWMR